MASNMLRTISLLAMLLTFAHTNAPIAVANAAMAPAPDPALVRIMNDVRSNKWAEAQTLAAAQPDRLVAKLVTYYRLLDPGAASDVAIDRFMVQNPDWPLQYILRRRWSEALAADTSNATLRTQCLKRVPVTAAANAACAGAFELTRPAKAESFVRRAWVLGYANISAATSFSGQYGGMLTPQTYWARFQHLALAGNVAMATATQGYVPPADQPVAYAWIELADHVTDAPTALAALTPAQRATPFLFFAELAAAPDTAHRLALWQRYGTAAEIRAHGLARALFWGKRNAFARDLLQSDHPNEAYAIVAAARPTSEVQRASRDFLAGFIALRLLDKPARARPWFLALSQDSKAAITRARAFYWLAQTESGAAATADLARAAAYPDTYYGQLAALQNGETPTALATTLRSLTTPPIAVSQEANFAERQLPQAAVILTEMGAPRRARAFLYRMAALAPGFPDRYLDARLAIGLGQTPTAVMVARLAGVSGDMLVGPGWPIPPGLARHQPSRSVILSLIRQESSFDPRARSGSGALGLMQLMPGTARMVAAKTGLAIPAAGLMADPAGNIALGSAYFASLMSRFGNCLPLAIAAYNAGPRNVETWLTENGDPRLPASAGGVNMITWIEEIPFGETRNYVQRVTEGIVIYRALQGKPAHDPITRWLPTP